MSYLELYNEEVSDLLSKTACKRLEVHVRPDVGVHVKDLSCFVVKNADEMEKLMTIGDRNSKLFAWATTFCRQHFYINSKIVATLNQGCVLFVHRTFCSDGHERAFLTLSCDIHSHSGEE